MPAARKTPEVHWAFYHCNIKRGKWECEKGQISAFFRQKEGAELYRHNTIYRRKVDKKTGNYEDTVLMHNRARVLYDHSYVPQSAIRQQEEERKEKSKCSSIQ